VHFFYFPSPGKGGEGTFYAFRFGVLDKLRVHAGNLVVLAVDSCLQVFGGGLDPFQGAQVVQGVHGLGVGSSTEKPGNLGIAIGVGFLSKGDVTAVGLGFSGKGGLEIGVGFGHGWLLTQSR
jgi:hypothetical protein